MFRLYLFTILLLVVTHHDVVANYADECVTPSNQAGQCMPIPSCSSIIATLKEHGLNIPATEKRFIQQSFCGVFNGINHVCCPKEDIILNSDAMQMLQNISCGYFDLPRVAYGEEAILFTFPWMALLKYDDDSPFKCGGTLINERYVLTAAHCVVGIKYPLLEVRLGEHKISTVEDCQYFGKQLVCAPPVEDIEVEEIIPHPNYSRFKIQHDIALIRLKQQVEFKRHIRPICLPITQQLMTEVPENFFVSGWGNTEKGNSSDVLLWANIPNLERSLCNEVFKSVSLTPGQLCVGGNNMQDSCRGDSGGPLAQVGRYNKRLRLVQFGIVSFGIASCGEKNLPAVYTNVPQYMHWITQNIKA